MRRFKDWLRRVPTINFRTREGHNTIAPIEGNAVNISNYEIPQLYPVFLWGILGIGKPDLHY
ncbi:MAG: hypothetical protein WCA84_08365 [Ignavibacteriaceae bacterium]|jgi:hypothetical protein